MIIAAWVTAALTGLVGAAGMWIYHAPRWAGFAVFYLAFLVAYHHLLEEGTNA